jgi:hypothetical protein
MRLPYFFCLLALLWGTATQMPTWAAPAPAPSRFPSAARALDYLRARKGHTISTVGPHQALTLAGNNGKLVEWAGTVDGMTTAADGMYLSLHMHGGEAIKIRLATAGTWALGKAVYVLGRIVEEDGRFHHLDALAMAPASEVTHVQVANLQKAMSAEEAYAMQSKSAFMAIDSRTLEAHAALSLDGAVRWIHSFNPTLDNAVATEMARSVLYYCARYGVNARMALSLFAAESAFHDKAVSSAGAQGLGQLMPGTAATLGVNPFNRVENVEGSVRYLAGLLARWHGSPAQWQLTLASYNAGVGAVEQYHGVPPYAETIQYIRTIFSYYTELSQYP